MRDSIGFDAADAAESRAKDERLASMKRTARSRTPSEIRVRKAAAES